MSVTRFIRPGAYGPGHTGNHIVLVTTGQGPYKGMWNLPGDGIEFGETPEEALRREFEEKTGLVDLPDPELIDSLSQTETHPLRPDTEMHLLGFLIRVELATRFPVKSVPNGNDPLGASWIHSDDIASLTIGRFARRGVDR